MHKKEKNTKIIFNILHLIHMSWFWVFVYSIELHIETIM